MLVLVLLFYLFYQFLFLLNNFMNKELEKGVVVTPPNPEFTKNYGKMEIITSPKQIQGMKKTPHKQSDCPARKEPYTFGCTECMPLVGDRLLNDTEEEKIFDEKISMKETPLQDQLGMLVRDLTSVSYPRSKSEVKRRIQEYADDYANREESFYSTIVGSDVWKEWIELQEKELKFDVWESTECNMLSLRHFEAFIKWVKNK